MLTVPAHPCRRALPCSDAEICQRHPFELYCKFPALSPFYTQFEKTFVRTSPSFVVCTRAYVMTVLTGGVLCWRLRVGIMPIHWGGDYSLVTMLRPGA